jgi:hypothetical protein
LGKIKAGLLLVILLIIVSLQTINVAEADPIAGQSLPKVAMPNADVNATIYEINGQFWVSVDAEYQMHTIYGFGDSFTIENAGMGLVLDHTQQYVTVTVTEDLLEAHYPIPANATNISVKIDGNETEWYPDKENIHLFGDSLPQINWTITPVPRDYNLTVHYEQPILPTNGAYGYLGNYSFMLPLYGRYGCSVKPYPLYDWSGHTPPSYTIKVEGNIPGIAVYSISNLGTLTPLNITSVTENGLQEIRATTAYTDENRVMGAVAVFNSPIEETGLFPTLNIAIGMAVAVIGIIAVGVYLKRYKQR